MTVDLIVTWTRGIGGSTDTLTDVTRVDIRRGKEAKHNTCDVHLQNNLYSDDRIYVDDDGELLFQSEDPVKIYVKRGDGTAIDTSTTDDLIFSGRIVEFQATIDGGKSGLKLMLSDSSYVALNKLWVGDEEDTSPNLIVNQLIPWVNDGIQDPANQITATLGASSVQNTPAVAGAYRNYRITKVFKPVYEIISDLSQPKATGDGDRAYKFHIDKNNTFKWFYPDDAASHVIEEGATAALGATTYTHPENGVESVTDNNYHRVTNIKLKNAVYDTTNFIIYKAGEDMNNLQILGFEYDATSGAPITKDSFRNWEQIARDMKLAAESDPNGAITKTTGDVYTYPSYGGGFIPVWDSVNQTTVTSDSTYNDAFIAEANRRAKAAAQDEFEKGGNARFKGSIELQGEDNFDANEGIVFTSGRLGVNKIFLRINEVKHNISKGGWFTTLDVEEQIQKEFAT